MLFKFPIVAIVGENGVGKSTFLKAAVCAYKNETGNDFYPSNMFIRTQWDTVGMKHAHITYKIRQGSADRELHWKKTNDWGFSPKGKKPKRSVFFLDISRTLPLDATAGYAKIAKMATKETEETVELNDESLRELSYVLGQSYTRARFTETDVGAGREIGLLTSHDGEVSQFHQGAGEDVILDMFKLLQTIPQNALLVIDEVENSLHPQAQRRFVRYLLKLTRRKKLQIILSTHSPFILYELPPVARIMLSRLSDRKEILYDVSPEFALSIIDEKKHPELYVYLEDNEALQLFWGVLKKDNEKYSQYCKRIEAMAVGSCNTVNIFDILGKEGKLLKKSLAVIDGDKRDEFPNCLALPGNSAPERQIIMDLQTYGWGNAKLDERFGIGAGSLFKILDDATVLPDHHDWTTYIGDRIKMSKDFVWRTLVDCWCDYCLKPEQKDALIAAVETAINNKD